MFFICSHLPASYPYLWHKNIQHTVIYTQLAADRFNGFWND
jgi:hypothetical protein